MFDSLRMVVFITGGWIIISIICWGVPLSSLLDEFTFLRQFDLVARKNTFGELNELVLNICELAILHLIELLQFARLSYWRFTASI